MRILKQISGTALEELNIAGTAMRDIRGIIKNFKNLKRLTVSKGVVIPELHRSNSRKVQIAEE